MKTVKINYARVDDYFDKKQNLIYDILKTTGMTCRFRMSRIILFVMRWERNTTNIANIPRFGSCIPAKTTSRILI